MGKPGRPYHALIQRMCFSATSAKHDGCLRRGSWKFHLKPQVSSWAIHILVAKLVTQPMPTCANQAFPKPLRQWIMIMISQKIPKALQFDTEIGRLRLNVCQKGSAQDLPGVHCVRYLGSWTIQSPDFLVQNPHGCVWKLHSDPSKCWMLNGKRMINGFGSPHFSDKPKMYIKVCNYIYIYVILWMEELLHQLIDVLSHYL